MCKKNYYKFEKEGENRWYIFLILYGDEDYLRLFRVIVFN